MRVWKLQALWRCVKQKKWCEERNIPHLFKSTQNIRYFNFQRGPPFVLAALSFLSAFHNIFKMSLTPFIERILKTLISFLHPLHPYTTEKSFLPPAHLSFEELQLKYFELVSSRFQLLLVKLHGYIFIMQNCFGDRQGRLSTLPYIFNGCITEG